MAPLRLIHPPGPLFTARVSLGSAGVLQGGFPSVVPVAGPPRDTAGQCSRSGYWGNLSTQSAVSALIICYKNQPQERHRHSNTRKTTKHSQEIAS